MLTPSSVDDLCFASSLTGNTDETQVAFGTLDLFLAGLAPVRRGWAISILQMMTALAPTDLEMYVAILSDMTTVSQMDRELVMDTIRTLASLRGEQLVAGLPVLQERAPEEIPEEIETEEPSATSSFTKSSLDLDSLSYTATTGSPERESGGRTPRIVSPAYLDPSDLSSRSFRLHGERFVGEAKEEIQPERQEQDFQRDPTGPECTSDGNILLGPISDLNHDEGTDEKAGGNGASSDNGEALET
jgi:hypothetical protein